MVSTFLWNNEALEYFQILKKKKKKRKRIEKRLCKTESKQEFPPDHNMEKYFLSSNFRQKKKKKSMRETMSV